MIGKTAALICLTLPLAVASAEEGTKVFPAAALRAMAIRTEAGDILVEAGAAPQVEVRITKPDRRSARSARNGWGGPCVWKPRAEEGSLFGGSSCEAGFQVQAPEGPAVGGLRGAWTAATIYIWVYDLVLLWRFMGEQMAEDQHFRVIPGRGGQFEKKVILSLDNPRTAWYNEGRLANGAHMLFENSELSACVGKLRFSAQVEPTDSLTSLNLRVT